MRKSRFSVEQIAMALRQGEAGTPVAEIIRKLGISEQTYYRWKRKYRGPQVLLPRVAGEAADSPEKGEQVFTLS